MTEMSSEEISEVRKTAKKVIDRARCDIDVDKQRLAQAVLDLSAKLEREHIANKNLTDALLSAITFEDTSGVDE